MTQSLKIGIIVGGVSIIGLGLYFLLKNNNTSQREFYPPLPQPNQNGSPKVNWTGLITTVIDSLPQNAKNTNSNGEVVSVIQPTTRTSSPKVLFVQENKWNASEIKNMQTYLTSLGGQSKMWIESTGGADGIIGNGFKQAYTWAVLGQTVADMNDLSKKSGN